MITTPISNMDVRKVNRNRIYRIIHGHPGISRPEIAKRLHMSLPTVLLNMKSLLEKGLVEERGSLESTGGRKAAAMSIVSDARQAIGIDITRRRVVVVLVDLDGTVCRQIELRLGFSPKQDYVEKIGKAVDDLLEKENVAPGRLVGAGISIPGILSANGEAMTASYVLGTASYYSFEAMDARLAMPCVHVNDADAAGIAEMWGGDPERHFVYMGLSNSVGGALVWDGSTLRGDNRRSGEIGHMTLVPGGRTCSCGKKGCLDAYCNAGILSGAAGGDLGAFFKLLDDGDRKAQSIWKQYLEHLAVAVNSLRMAFDYDIVIGGYVGAHIGSRIDELRTRAAELNSFFDSGDFVKPCHHNTEPSAVGAALLQVENFIDSI